MNTNLLLPESATNQSRAIYGDCLPIMATYKDKEFDLAIVDPPYGIDGDSHRKNKSRGKQARSKDYHNVLWGQEIPPQAYFDELFRISKHQIIWGINYFIGCRDLKIGGGRIVWDKVNADTTFSDAEIAYCSLFESVRLIPFMWNGMMQGVSFADGRRMQGRKALNEKRIHPTQKPVELYKWCFQKYTKRGQRVIDTHLGSGSSRIAADMMELDFTGIEIDSTHYIDQENRYKEYKSVLKLPLNFE